MSGRQELGAAPMCPDTLAAAPPCHSLALHRALKCSGLACMKGQKDPWLQGFSGSSSREAAQHELDIWDRPPQPHVRCEGVQTRRGDPRRKGWGERQQRWIFTLPSAPRICSFSLDLFLRLDTFEESRSDPSPGALERQQHPTPG